MLIGINIDVSSVARVGAIPSPSDIDGLQVWFKANALSLSDTDPVATWADSSGNARNGTQATGGKQPTYKANQVNGLPSVLFDQVNDQLATASVSHGIGTGDFTFFCVSRLANTAPNYRAVAGNDAFSPAFYYHGTKPNLYWGSDHIYSTVLANSTWYLFVFVRSGSDINLWVNGIQDATTATISTSMSDAAWIIGDESIAGGSSFGGDIAEQGLYNIALDSTQREQLEAYISSKYAIF